LCACLCAETLGDARSMNWAHLWILCRYDAKFHATAGLNLLYGSHVPNRPVGLHIPFAIYYERKLYLWKSGNKYW